MGSRKERVLDPRRSSLFTSPCAASLAAAAGRPLSSPHPLSPCFSLAVTSIHFLRYGCLGSSISDLFKARKLVHDLCRQLTQWCGGFHKFFSNIGFIKDVYLPNKRSKRTGNRFGFVRYETTRDVEQAVDKANGFWIGKRSLIVERASYDKGLSYSTFSAKSFVGVFGSSGYQNHKFQYEIPNHHFEGNGVSLDQIRESEGIFTLNLQPTATEWLTRSAIAKLKDLTTHDLVQRAFNEMNFSDVGVKSVTPSNFNINE